MRGELYMPMAQENDNIGLHPMCHSLDACPIEQRDTSTETVRQQRRRCLPKVANAFQDHRVIYLYRYRYRYRCREANGALDLYSTLLVWSTPTREL